MIITFDDSNSLVFWQGRTEKSKDSEYIVFHNFDLSDSENKAKTFNIENCFTVFKEIHGIAVSDAFEIIISFGKDINNYILNSWLGFISEAPEESKDKITLKNNLRKIINFVYSNQFDGI